MLDGKATPQADEIMTRLQRSGFHRCFKGRSIQVEVAEWYQKKGHQIEICKKPKDSDLVMDKTWLIDVCTSTMNRKGMYFFNNRHHEGGIDYYVFVVVDKPEKPMWCLMANEKDEYRKGFHVPENFDSDKFELTFVGNLR